jgi:NADP-dependent 3-hydroxy acid dehydrogenase YdfG
VRPDGVQPGGAQPGGAQPGGAQSGGAQPQGLHGRSALLTGASRGIGEAIARALDAQGVRTLLVARDAKALDTLSAALNRARAHVADLTDGGAVDATVEAAMRAFDGAPDVVIQNAGLFAIAPLEKTTVAAFEAALTVNTIAPFRIMRALIPHMRRRGSGHIVTIGSVADRMIFPGNAAYAASKHALRALHEVARAELNGSGVRTTLVSPGPVDTDIWDEYAPDITPGLTPRAQMLRTDDVARAVVWAIDQPAFVNVDEVRISHS